MIESWGEWYRRDILPRLTAETVYGAFRFHSRSTREWRGPCPLHGGNNPTAFRVNPQTLHWTCFTGCQRSGDVLDFLNGGESPRGPRFEEVIRKAAELAQSSAKPVLRRSEPLFNPSPRPALEEALERYQSHLPGSWGERYLHHRGIPLEVALRYGLGYAPPGQWLHTSRDWRWGRLVVPHTNPRGELVNLYGRAVGSNEKVPRAIRHDHLPGEKGYLCGQALGSTQAGPLFVCEGPFDALSLLAAGYSRVVAIFGARGWRWDWAREVDHLVFAFDIDAAGQRAQQELARAGLLRGKRVASVCAPSLGLSKDLNEWWCYAASTSIAAPATSMGVRKVFNPSIEE